MIVCAALALNSFWAPLFFQFFTEQIIAVDSAALRLAYSALRPDIVADGALFKAAGNFGILIVGACSVFSSASVAVLATVALIQNKRAGFKWRDLAATVLVLLAMLFISTARLVIYGWSSESFRYWHNGDGVSIIEQTQILLMGGIAFVCANWAVREK